MESSQQEYDTKMTFYVAKSAAILGLITSGFILVTNILTLINFRDIDEAGQYERRVTLVDFNSGNLYFGIVGGSISCILYFMLLLVTKKTNKQLFYFLL